MDARERCQARGQGSIPRHRTMTKQDITNAITFLRRVVARGAEEDVLIRTVEALEKELERRNKK